MRVVELDDAAWLRLKRRLMFRGADALEGLYEPPVKLVHGCEYVVYEKGEEDEEERCQEGARPQADQ